MRTTADTFWELHRSGQLELPDPGRGSTPARHLALIRVARRHRVGVARLVEAHTDAISILHEADRQPIGGSTYGVWASAGADDPILDNDTLTGTKEFCTGLGIVDRALISVTDNAGRACLLDVDVSRSATVSFDTAAWSTSALDDTATGNAIFDRHRVDGEAIGPHGWYLERPGFWHGACGPAACWAGAAIGLVDAAVDMGDDDPHRLAHLGAMLAHQWALHALFAAAGDEIDRTPSAIGAAEIRARSLRQTTERMCSDILDRFSRSLGPRPFTTDASVARRFADTHLYIRQHHAERELGLIAARARPPTA